MPVRFGIIGLGNIAAMHAQAFTGLADAVLHSCCSRDAQKAAAFAGQYGGRPSSDLAEFLADPELDAVTICTPSGAHLEPALAAARAGKHILVEKPLEITPARCQRLIAACRQHGVKLATIFPFRFKESMHAVRNAIHAGRLGTLVSASAYVKWYRSQDYYDQGGWRGTWKLDGGGCLMNQGIHAADCLLWCAGNVNRVSAFASRPTRQRVEAETNLVANLQFANGALGVIEASTEIFPGTSRRLEFCGTAGTIVTVDERVVQWNFATPLAEDAEIRHRFAPLPAVSGNASTPMAFKPESHRRQFQEFVAVVTGRARELSCDGREGARSVKLVCGIYQSIRHRRPVTIKWSAARASHSCD
ncbi:MAG: Inositol 2-dehydrogenase/D-chiro-inositol 3-dehydrogenase [Verrucomicrobiae bacterium]|nr:Inositol 2-dehydrogenase/D-chiro-inositol 3-dehydrogenase [Verrucomicrobiae bacterium]